MKNDEIIAKKLFYLTQGQKNLQEFLENHPEEKTPLQEARSDARA